MSVNRHLRLKVNGLSEYTNANVTELHFRSQNDDIFTNESKLTIYLNALRFAQDLASEWMETC